MIDAGFIYTEPHSRRIKVRITVQKEVEGALLEQTFVVDYTVANLQCDDCKKTFTPHTWVAKVQLRQRVEHQRTFHYLEQLILKYSAHDKVLKIKQVDKGLDFHFSNRSHANRFVDFIRGIVPVQVKPSKHLISHDLQNNTYNYKYTFSVEIIPICKDDLLVLPNTHNTGGFGPLVLCHKVSNTVQLINPFTTKRAELLPDRYWSHSFRAYAAKTQMAEFIVLDIEEEPNTQSMEIEKRGPKFKRVEVEVAKADMVGVESHRLFTHLGNILKVGDSVMGYDLKTLNSNEADELPPNSPEVVLVKKVYPHLQRPNRKRVFKLNRMNIENNQDKDYDEFLDELEEDPEIRGNVNMYRNEGAQLEAVDDDTFPGVKLEELLDGLTLEDK
eukprot:CAMPEP_0202427048 /NCGR_PEP_ID=MMETSP1345-20130828/1330_1 /ASSEMBLY_ACC=CAM_ASM_000843 /TAXON_ID=342563 /ORGANISM="Fabrea Fabrea salina" /LENGTH=385 /DNA_ID=CAMNT_0049037639 /DNA_START=232 /DNA_END=1392 /DNA_ORIENTATION=+